MEVYVFGGYEHFLGGCNPFKCKDAQKNDLYLAHISLQGHCSAHYDLFLDRSIFIMSPLSLANCNGYIKF